MDVARMDTAAKNRRVREQLLDRCTAEADLRAFVLDYLPAQQAHIPEQGSLQDQITRLIARAGADAVLEALEQAASATAQSAASAGTPGHSFIAEPAPWPWFELQWRGMSGAARQSIREFLDVYLGTP